MKKLFVAILLFTCTLCNAQYNYKQSRNEKLLINSCGLSLVGASFFVRATVEHQTDFFMGPFIVIGVCMEIDNLPDLVRILRRNRKK